VSKLLNISSSPHVRSKTSTKNIMFDVLLALTPAALFGIYNFGIRALVLIVVCMASCVLSEYIWQKAMGLPLTVSDGSAALTGLFLALNLSSKFPIWMAILGSVFAIIIVKQLFGGLGQNFMNPALGARCFLMVSFAGKMTSFAYDKAVGLKYLSDSQLDAITGATPLASIKDGSATLDWAYVGKMFLGTTGGTIGETSALLLLIGAAYLLFKKVITWKIPVCYIVTFAVFVLLFGGHGFDLTYLAAELCGGGLILGAFFMATDYVTSPITPKGQIIFGILLGLLTGIFRIFGASAEGVSYAIIICNLLVPLIEKVTIPVPFGKEGLKDGK
jgi:electron transport complex protein RnfD